MVLLCFFFHTSKWVSVFCVVVVVVFFWGGGTPGIVAFPFKHHPRKACNETPGPIPQQPLALATQFEGQKYKREPSIGIIYVVACHHN